MLFPAFNCFSPVYAMTLLAKSAIHHFFLRYAFYKRPDCPAGVVPFYKKIAGSLSRMRMYFCTATLLLFLMPAGAQPVFRDTDSLSRIDLTDTTGLLGLQEAIALSLRNNLGIAIQQNQISVARTNNFIGVAGGLPQVAITINDNESFTNVNQRLNNGTIIKRNGAASNNLQTSLVVSQLLYNGRRIYYTRQRLATLEQLSQHQLTIQINNTIAAVATSYYDVVRQQDYERTLRLGIQVVQKQVDLITVRKSVGLANNADLFQAQIDLNTLVQGQIQQELAVLNAKADLLTLLNLRPDSSIRIRDTILVRPALPIMSIVEHIRQNPELVAARRQIRINELLALETGTQRYPSLQLNSGLNYNRNQNAAGFTLLNQNYGPFVGLGLSIPIYNGQVLKRQQEVAEINTETARLSLEQLSRNLENSAVKSYQAYQNVLQRIRTEQDNFRLTQQLLQLTQQRYELRVATILELRQAQQNFIDGGYRLVNLAFAAKAAEIELQRLGGRFENL